LYFGRVESLSALDFENLSDERQKKSRIMATNRGDLPTDLSHLCEINVLGDGMSGMVKLMEDEDAERYAVKDFRWTWDQTEGKAAAVFSREFTAHYTLNHPCVVQFYGFSAAAATSGATLVLKYMDNGSLMDAFERVKASNQPRLWTHTRGQ
jgi:serine/threonine protein kinase